jgi:hypothetical protein
MDFVFLKKPPMSLLDSLVVLVGHRGRLAGRKNATSRWDSMVAWVGDGGWLADGKTTNESLGLIGGGGQRWQAKKTTKQSS